MRIRAALVPPAAAAASILLCASALTSSRLVAEALPLFSAAPATVGIGRALGRLPPLPPRQTRTLLCSCRDGREVDEDVDHDRSSLADDRDVDGVGSHCSPSATIPPTGEPGSVSHGSLPAALTERQRGVLVLLTVPLAWGTYEPAVRYVYSASVSPAVPPFAFSLAYYAVAAGALVVLAALEQARTAPSPPWTVRRRPQTTAPASTLKPYPPSDELAPLAHNDPAVVVAGGLELGTYLFVGNALQLLGLRTVPADRAAFLLQLTTVFVPLLEAATAKSETASVPLRVWIASAVALAGVFVMGWDDPAAVTSFEGPVPAYNLMASGDLLVVGAAAAYTFHCLRLEKYAKEIPSALQLAAAKATTEAVLTLATVAVCVSYYYYYLYLANGVGGDATGVVDRSNVLARFVLESGRDLVEYAGAVRDGFVTGNGGPLSLGPPALSSSFGPAVAATLWTGWVTVAYTIYAQSYGQRRVRPVTANLIYTVQPICTALVAWLVLGETMGPAGYAGGALIGAAVLLVVANPAG